MYIVADRTDFVSPEHSVSAGDADTHQCHLMAVAGHADVARTHAARAAALAIEVATVTNATVASQDCLFDALGHSKTLV
jgi:hypothetical protein